MKKQVLVMLAALFVFVTLYPLGAYAADNVYAILYEDGTFVFQHGDTPESGKTVTKTYEVDLTAKYMSSNSVPWYNERESVLVVSFADKISPTSTANWFYWFRNLERIDNIKNLDTANITDMSYMFYMCGGLTALDVSHFDTSKVIGMIAIFYGCGSLTALDLSHWDTANVMYMETMFHGCHGLTTLNLSNFDTANVRDMRFMFRDCVNLKTVYVSEKFTTASMATSNRMFSRCTSLVGGSGTTYDENHIDAEYARIDTPSAPGYFTDVSAMPAYAITAAAPENGKLSVTLTNPAAATVAVSCFDTNGKFMSASVQSVQANAGTVTLALSVDTKAARVMLFDEEYRPLCAPFAAVV